MNFNDTCTSTLSEDGEVSFHSELMKNYVAESVVDGNHQLKVIHHDEIPLLFSINTKQELFVIYPKDGTQSGWEQYQLSNGLGEVTAFDISQDSSGAFLIGMATKKEGVSSLFINELTNFMDIDWENFEPASFWQQFEIKNNEETVNIIKADPEGILFATEIESQDASYYTLDTKNGIQQFQLPENGSTVLQMSLGKVHGTRGVFLLYQLDENQTMLYQSFPDPKYHKTVKYRYDTEGSLEDFFLIQDEEGTDHIYTAGDGVFLFTDPGAPKQIVVEKTGNINYKNIEATKDENKVTLWLRGEEQGKKRNLYKVENQYHASNGDTSIRWNKPLPLMSEVEQFTCLGGKKISNHLFFINSDNTLSYLWKDTSTTLWQQQPIPLSSSRQGREIDTYSLNLQFNPLHFEKKIKLRASSAIYVKINSKGYLLSPNKYAEISLNLQGTINLLNEVNNINAPTLYIEAEFLENEIAIDLTHKTCERLRKIQQGKDLANAKKQDGTSLWKDKKNKPDNNTMNKTSLAIQKFLDTKEHLEKKAADTNGTNEIWQIQFNKKKKLSVYSGHQAEQNLQGLLQKSNVNSAGLTANTDPLDEFGHSIGDFFQWASNRVVDISDFVCKTVGDVVTFVIEIAGEIFQFVIKSVEAILSVMMWLFEKIGVFLGDLIEWLGFLFNWDDILRTKDVLKTMINCSLNDAKEQVTQFQGDIQNYFNDIRRDFIENKPEIPKKISDEKILARNKKPVASSINTPQAAWGNQFLHNPKTFQPSIEPTTPEITLDGLAEDQLQVINNIVSQLSDEFVTNIPKLDFGTLFSRVLKIISEVLIDTLENFTLFLTEIVKQIFNSLKEIVNQHWDVFLLTWLYEEVIAPGSKLSLLDLICLIIAIPSCVLTKIVSNSTPFSKADVQGIKNAVNMNDFTQYLFSSKNENIKPYKKRNSKRFNGNELILNTGEVESPALNITIGIITATSSILYGALNILSKVIENTFIVNLIKTIFGIINYATSVISLIFIPPSDDTTKERDHFYTQLTLMQFFFVLLDSAELIVDIYLNKNRNIIAKKYRASIQQDDTDSEDDIVEEIKDLLKPFLEKVNPINTGISILVTILGTANTYFFYRLYQKDIKIIGEHDAFMSFYLLVLPMTISQALSIFIDLLFKINEPVIKTISIGITSALGLTQGLSQFSTLITVYRYDVYFTAFRVPHIEESE